MQNNTKVDKDLQQMSTTQETLLTADNKDNNNNQGLKYTLYPGGKSYSVAGIGISTDANIVIPFLYNDKPVTEIANSAFMGCWGLTNITIPGSVNGIGGGAFVGCTGLKSVTIGNGLRRIGKVAFNKCFFLRTINFSDTVEKWQRISKDNNWDKDTGSYVVYCTDGEITKSGIITYY